MLAYPKNTRAFCSYCHDLVFVFNRDILKYDVWFCVSALYPDKGQGPFFENAALVCKKCETPLSLSELKFKIPGK